MNTLYFKEGLDIFSKQDKKTDLLLLLLLLILLLLFYFIFYFLFFCRVKLFLKILGKEKLPEPHLKFPLKQDYPQQLR